MQEKRQKVTPKKVANPTKAPELAHISDVLA
jgi:hypothetical protein